MNNKKPNTQIPELIELFHAANMAQKLAIQELHDYLDKRKKEKESRGERMTSDLYMHGAGYVD